MRVSSQHSRWLPMATFAVVSSANQMLWLNFAPITTGTAERVGVSSSTVGLLAEVFPIIYVVLALPTGLCLDRWFRPALAAGAVLTGTGALVRLAGGGFAPLLVGQLIVALGQPALLNAVTGLATRTLEEKDRPVGIAIGSAGTFLGFILAFGLALALGAGHLHAILVASGAYAAVGAVLLLVAVPQVREAGGRVGAVAAGAWAAQREAIAAVWADRVVRLIAGIVFLGFGVFVAMTTWLQTLLQDKGVGATTSDIMLMAMVAAGVVASVTFPPTVARRRLQGWSIGVAAGVGGAACLLLAATPGRATGYGALAAFGFVLLPALPVLLELLEKRSGQWAGTATGLLWLSGNAGGVVVALLVQALVGSTAASFALMAVCAALALPLAVRLGAALGDTTTAQRLVRGEPHAELRPPP